MSVEVRRYGRTAGGLSLDPTINPLTARWMRAENELEDLARSIAAALTPDETARLRAMSFEELTARIRAAAREISGPPLMELLLDDDLRVPCAVCGSTEPCYGVGPDHKAR